MDALDLAVEILSPDGRMSQVLENLFFYLTNGVRLVRLIDPATRIVTVMTSPAALRSLAEDDTLDGGDVLPGFSTPAREILPTPEIVPA